LLYDPKFKRVKWCHENKWAISTIKNANETVIPEYLSCLLQIKGEAETANTTCAIAEIDCPNEPYLAGGPGLVALDNQGRRLVEVFNMGPEPITLARGQLIGQIDNIPGQPLVPFDADLVN
jgi:hypothetical protein